jgi:hypothetical protein
MHERFVGFGKVDKVGLGGFHGLVDCQLNLVGMAVDRVSDRPCTYMLQAYNFLESFL